MSQGLTLAAFKSLSQQTNVLIVDTRKPTEFTEGFIPGSVFIGLGENFEEWAKKILPAGKQLLLVANVCEEITSLKRLQDAGFSVSGYLEGGYAVWKEAHEPVDMIIDIEADELAMDIPFDEKMVIIDVRTPEEYNQCFVKNALNIPVEQVNDPAITANFEEEDNLYLHCAGGYRSVIAASLLKREGIHNLRNISGGFKSIKEVENIPLQKYKETE